MKARKVLRQLISQEGEFSSPAPRNPCLEALREKAALSLTVEHFV